MAFNPKDFYFKKAKKEKYVARSIFKLEEIDKKFRLFKNGYKVLDLGAAPGSWSQYATKKIGDQGRLVGIDLKKIELTISNAYFVEGDFTQLNLEKVLEEAEIKPPFDVVMSDMAPKTTGVKITDQTRSFELCMSALQAAEQYLKPRGHFICKLFQSSDFEKLRGDMRRIFNRVEFLKPKSTRKISTEIFLVGLQKKD